MYKNFQKSTNNRPFKYSFVASFCIMALLFTFVGSTAYGETITTVTNIGNHKFMEPGGLAVDSSGDNIYVAGSSIEKIDISSNTTTTAAVQCEYPGTVALDSSDNIYVIDFSDRQIYKTDKGGSTTLLETSNYGVSDPYEIAIDSKNNIYVLQQDKISIFSSDGEFIDSFNKRDNVDEIYGLAVDNIGNIYIEYYDINNRCAIDKLDSHGNFSATILSVDNESDSILVAVDRSNNVYISKYDTENSKNIIYKMNISGEMEVYASYDSEYEIGHMTVDKNGNIYVIEGDYVKKITVSPELKMDTANPSNATMGTAYSYQFTSTGGIGEKTYAVTDPSSLPAGLTLSEDGTLSGTPNTIGSSTFTIKVTDSEASTSSTTVNLTVLVPPTPVIVPPTSGGSSSSSSSSSDSTSTPVSDSTQFLATVTNGQSQYTAPPLPVVITTETDGTKKGKLEIKENVAKEIVDSLDKKRDDTARVIMQDKEGELSSLTASIPTAAIATFANAGKNLELETPNGGVTLSNQNMKDYVNASNQALYFTITPVSDAITQTETDISAVEQQIDQIEALQALEPEKKDLTQQQELEQLQQRLEQLKQLKQQQQQLPSDHPIRVGSSVDIESNMPHGISVGIRIPMGPVNSPAQEAEIKKDSASYAIFAEHSIEDIENLLISTIRIKDMIAIAEANTNRFSRFTIIRLSQNTTDIGSWQNDEQGWKYIRNGEPATGWNQIGGSWYLMDSNGIMQTGWQQINGTWYFLKDNGVMASNTVIDGYELGENGVWLYNQSV